MASGGTVKPVWPLVTRAKPDSLPTCRFFVGVEFFFKQSSKQRRTPWRGLCPRENNETYLASAGTYQNTRRSRYRGEESELLPPGARGLAVCVGASKHALFPFSIKSSRLTNLWVWVTHIYLLRSYTKHSIITFCFRGYGFRQHLLSHCSQQFITLIHVLP